MEYIIGFIILVVVIAGFQINNTKKMAEERKAKRKKLNSELNEIKGFTFSKRLVSKWGLMALDKENRQIAVKSQFGKINVHSFSAIHSCEILVNGQTTYKKSSVIGRSIAGGILAGNAGAIIGGLSGKEKKVEEVSSIDFKILFREAEETSFKYRLFDANETTGNTKKSIKESDAVYGLELKKAKSRLQYWKDQLEVIISSQEKIDKSQNISLSISDELLKITELKEKGTLSQEEFEIMKSKLMEK
ncbi:hypothetical protein G1K52_11570 [Tenacibaculum finnmarkense]|uniref:hypothetical protein n=1 Tax=Tenacibaculum finnmarkense TaxID=2781243 RepID=UPI001E5A4ED1|nr:hypothetical protein [Tenacibaculum finnmarkense]MCD8401298.1 hypothetical protein [Tenacibaculum finnmarkense genomovar ulcerans]MCG8786397.1 hypothetical protein [Tenacibaculum finnmarkense]